MVMIILIGTGCPENSFSSNFPSSADNDRLDETIEVDGHRWHQRVYDAKILSGTVLCATGHCQLQPCHGESAGQLEARAGNAVTKGR